MSKIHFFQRFAQKENVVTNNTLLLLSRLYEIDRLSFEDLLDGLTTGLAKDKVGMQFIQQKKGAGGRIIDGLMTQASFKIAIETKLGTAWNIAQLEGHLKIFQGSEDIGVLILLAPTALNSMQLSQAQDKLKKRRGELGGKGPGLCPLTFEELLKAARESYSQNKEAEDMLEDYEGFAASAGLLPTTSYILRAVPCGISWEDNKRLCLYYEPKDRPSQEASYIGIYAWKSVRLIGKVTKTVLADVKKESFLVAGSNLKVSDKEKARIREATECAIAYGWPSEERKFRLVDKFFETNFEKISSGGIRKNRNFNLKEILGADFSEDPAIIAEKLKTKKWE